MDWTADQSAARDAFARWYANRQEARRRPFRLFGYAGTGKTTLARTLAAEAGGRVVYAAPTGKAAQVLASKGCVGARTIHSLIYHIIRPSQATLNELKAKLAKLEGLKNADPYEIARLEEAIKDEEENIGRPHWSLNLESDLIGADLLVLDEASMPDEQTGRDLLSFGVPILALGDPGQLPPIKGAGYFTQDKPDYVLEEIHRNAGGIVWAATKVRRGEALPTLGEHGDDAGMFIVAPKSEFAPANLEGVNIILCGKNETRRAVNARYRRQRFEGERVPILPRQGEPLICRRNDRDTGLLNGMTGRALCDGLVYEDDKSMSTLDFVNDDGIEFRDLMVVNGPFLAYIGREYKRNFFQEQGLQEFDFAYAITVHASQGSQWDNVAIADDRMRAGDREFRKRWLYTAITRAAKECRIYI